MHFTLWPSLTSSEGTHGEITWGSFLAFVSNPAITEDKSKLEGWSPAKFKANRRSKADVEAVSCVVLDDDESGFSAERIHEIWHAYDYALHSSFSHRPEAPRWRIILRCSRDMTADEYARVWQHVVMICAEHGQVLDSATKDPSRLWFVPARKGSAEYVHVVNCGVPLDVDAILALPQGIASPTSGVAEAASAKESGAARRTPIAAMLGAAWPAKGRHEAQLALAGALRNEGWSESEALEFLCAVCRLAGDEDRPKREATCRHTWAKPAGEPLTGWSRLKKFVDPFIVDAARSTLGRDAELAQKIAQRTAELSMPARAPATVEPSETPNANQPAPLGFEYGIWDTEPPPIDFLVEGLIPRGSIGMIFGRADALKTWLLFSLGIAAASGQPWLGRFAVKRPIKVGIVDYETGSRNVRKRLFMLRAGQNQNLGARSFAPLRPSTGAFWEALAQERFDLVIVDSLRKANPGADENDSEEATRPLTLAAEFSEQTGCAVYFIHHATKSSADGWPQFRGSGAIEDQVDISFAVRKIDVTTEKKTVEVRCDKSGDMRAPEPFSVEATFDDLKRSIELKYVDAPKDKPTEDESTEIRNKRLVIEILKKHTAGVAKSDLVNIMVGRRQNKFALLSQLSLAGITIEFKDSALKKDIVMLRPGVEI